MGHYEVPGMTLIKQAKRMSCWYASAKMLIKWREDRDKQCLAWLVPPELDAECARLRDSNHGIQNPQITEMAKRLGLKAIPPISPTPEALEHWLRIYGPLWVNGKTHIVVIGGINTAALTVKVYDPDPSVPVDWRPLEGWYALGNSASTRDTGADVNAVLLYVPEHQ